MFTTLLTYTDLECFEYFKERYPNGHYRDELHLQVKQIIGYSHIKRKTAIASLHDLLSVVKHESDRIYLLAAYYLIRTKTTMKLRNLSIVQQEITEYKLKLSNNAIRKGCPTDKKVTSESLVKKIFALKNELDTIYAQHQVDPNITVTATLVKPNGFEMQV